MECRVFWIVFRILKLILCLIGSQFGCFNAGVMCSLRVVPVRRRAALFCASGNLFADLSGKPSRRPVW